jgi:hypothetical protein
MVSGRHQRTDSNSRTIVNGSKAKAPIQSGQIDLSHGRRLRLHFPGSNDVTRPFADSLVRLRVRTWTGFRTRARVGLVSNAGATGRGVGDHSARVSSGERVASGSTSAAARRGASCRSPIGPAFVSMTDVSVLTPSFGYGRFIADAIESVLSQEGVSVEHIVQDGLSQDETVDVLRRLGLRTGSRPVRRTQQGSFEGNRIVDRMAQRGRVLSSRLACHAGRAWRANGRRHRLRRVCLR